MPSPARWYYASPKDKSICSVCLAHNRTVRGRYVLISIHHAWPNLDDLRDTTYAAKENRVYRCAAHAPKCHQHAEKQALATRDKREGP